MRVSEWTEWKNYLTSGAGEWSDWKKEWLNKLVKERIIKGIKEEIKIWMDEFLKENLRNWMNK